jgi:transcriptional regulator with XRE-family HTH domain
MDANYTRDKIKALMNERGTTVAQLADALNVSQFVVYHWFNRGTQSFFQHLNKIAKYYNVSIDFLTGNDIDASISTEANKCLSILKGRPELRAFLKVANNSSAEDIGIATTLLKALNKRKG